VLWSGLVSRIGASYRVNLIAPFPLGQSYPRKITMTMTSKRKKRESQYLINKVGKVQETLHYKFGLNYLSVSCTRSFSVPASEGGLKTSWSIDISRLPWNQASSTDDYKQMIQERDCLFPGCGSLFVHAVSVARCLSFVFFPTVSLIDCLKQSLVFGLDLNLDLSNSMIGSCDVLWPIKQSIRAVFNWVSYDQNRSNHTGQSQRTYAIQ